VPNFVSIGLFCRLLAAKTPIFAIFWTLAFCGVTNWQQSEKVEHRYTTTHLLLSNGIKIVSVLQCLRGEIGRTISDIEHHDGQTDKQTKKLDVFGCPSGGRNLSPIKLGMVIEDLEHVHAPQKLLGSDA